MNIFYLDADPTKCAQYHIDRHVVKMVTEYAQLLSMALWRNDLAFAKRLYKRDLIMNPPPEVTGKKRVSHYTHPCTIWATKTRANFDWLHRMAVALGEEYFHRYGQFIDKQHRSLTHCLIALQSTDKFPDGPFTPPPQAMPEWVQGSNTITAYRRLYQLVKIDFASYTNREMPSWFIEAWKMKYLFMDAPSTVIPVYHEIKFAKHDLCLSL